MDKDSPENKYSLTFTCTVVNISTQSKINDDRCRTKQDTKE